MHHSRTSQRRSGQCENRDRAVNLQDRAGEHVGLPEMRPLLAHGRIAGRLVLAWEAAVDPIRRSSLHDALPARASLYRGARPRTAGDNGSDRVSGATIAADNGATAHLFMRSTEG
jgi:hypothetical protein